MKKLRFTAVTDPDEIEALEKIREELDAPLMLSPNGSVWVDAEDLKAWRQTQKIQS